MSLDLTTKGNIVKGIVLLILLGAAVLMLKLQKPVDYQTPQPAVLEPDMIVPERITVQGTYVECLPLHDNFSSKECVHGIKATNGSYYALDFALSSKSTPDFKEGDILTASGMLTPVEMLSSDYMYHTIGRGIISVTDFELDTTPSKPVTPKPTPGKESATGPCFVGGCSGQICSGTKDIVSTCEYREEYACYKTAKCERQADTGKCGWTPTAELNACLNR